ncbi:MAG: ferritin-like domain-containing protein [Parvularculaceae bacterium]|nr:ferritin-like domain-containing protein [Parvularculaceae bacterium]
MTKAGGWALLLAVLTTSDARAKAEAAVRASRSLADLDLQGWVAPPDRPARPPEPILAPPQRMPRRRLGSQKGRAALLHALAHIEFNAIDLAADLALRFAPAIAGMGLDWRRFVFEWTEIGAEEANHFSKLSRRLQDFGGHYGALPAHDGLWESAARTSDDVLARLAIAPLVLEARGLDVTPKIIADLENAGDRASAAILEVIYAEEVGHVRTGAAWFAEVARARGLEPDPAFRQLVAERFRGQLKPPFNFEARSAAGLPRSFYDPQASPAPDR